MKVELACLVEGMFQYTVLCSMWNNAAVTIFSLKLRTLRKTISTKSVSYSSKNKNKKVNEKGWFCTTDLLFTSSGASKGPFFRI